MDERNYHTAVAGKNKNKINLVSKQEILDVVSVRRDIPTEIIISKTRKREVCESRQICMFMAKQFRSDSLATIGTFYGGKDHATVLHANRTINDLIDSSLLMRGSIKEIMEDICDKLDERAIAEMNEEIYICSECNSRNVEIEKWTKANSDRSSDYEAIKTDKSWCCNCEGHSSLRMIRKSELDDFPVKIVVDISEFE